jgi:chemosensory pili system protein ChpA (sensor histidine kinase/response regulator)
LPLFSVCNFAEKAPMTFNTTSYLAGVGSVVAVLSTGFAGGYFLASPTHVDPPNRLQRLAAEDHATKAPAPATAAAKPEIVAAATPAAAPATPAPPVAPVVQPVPQQPDPQTAVLSAETKAAEPVRTVASQETSAPIAAGRLDADRANTEKLNADKANVEKVSADKARTAEAKQPERRRSEARKIAEQQRKQRELEVATIAVRRIIHDRDAPEIVRGREAPDRDAPIIIETDQPEPAAPEMPHFTLFGQ